MEKDDDEEGNDNDDAGGGRPRPHQERRASREAADARPPARGMELTLLGPRRRALLLGEAAGLRRVRARSREQRGTRRRVQERTSRGNDEKRRPRTEMNGPTE
ncbi:unnamed protein product [Prorocentrum cordatum]|uniref:Uncharacterized protein n=1 Tax=Prorocentrum cordatum TaxID=2364126 RepID=A0ABN9WZS4_9DINO|nr:unnamed protein product [Polarella glacialis]